MTATVIVNNLTVVHKRSGGTSIAAPDVCKTPTPSGPVPVPYVNTAMSKTTARGSRSVRVDREPLMLKSSHFASSRGDEPGTLGGIISGKTRGKAYPRSYSFDVRVEGENVVRLTDLMLQNGGSPTNTVPGVITQPNLAATGADPDLPEVVEMHWSKAEVVCGDPVDLAVKTTNAKDGQAVKVEVERTDLRALPKMELLMVELRGNRARERWISRRRHNFAVRVPSVAVQRTFRGAERSSNTLVIKTAADAKQLIGPALRTGEAFLWNAAMQWFEPTGQVFEWEYCYEISLSRGELMVKRKLDFDNRTGAPLSDRTWRQWKREIEAVWDNRILLHRTACRRGNMCDCAIQGCCKFRLRIWAQLGPGHGSKVKLFAGAPLAVNRGLLDLWWYSDTWWTRIGQAPRTVRAHEFGHLIGCYDEYQGGASNGRIIDLPGSIMEAGSTVHSHHIREFVRWFRQRAGRVVGTVVPCGV